jgi:hypothetical protein
VHMAGRYTHGRYPMMKGDVLVRRHNGERCVLSALTGTRAVIVIGESVDDLGHSFMLDVPQEDDLALLIGIHRLDANDTGPRVEIVFDDDHASPAFLESPSIPVAYVVEGLTPVGPAAVGAEQIESLMHDIGAPRPRRQSGAIQLGDITA